MTIYIDSAKKCHVSNDGTMQAVETDVFNGKCKEFIEGYCYVICDNSATVYPWRDYVQLNAIQNAVDRTQAEADEELAALIEEIYQEDLEVINNV